MKINLFMIVLCTIAQVLNGMTLYGFEHQSNVSQQQHNHNRVERHARILDIRMQCAPGMEYIGGRCRKLV